MAHARLWSQLEALLPAGWTEARVALQVDDEERAARAAAIAGPLNPGRAGDALVLRMTTAGGTHGVEAVKRMLARLEDEHIAVGLSVLDTDVPAAPAVAAAPAEGSLAPAWDAALALLPADWSDVYGEIEIESGDEIDRAALLLGPVNPKRNVEKQAFRFRAARQHGYGASVGMVRRCLERLDAQGVRGSVSILRALCETRPVATQGPQWVEGGHHV